MKERGEKLILVYRKEYKSPSEEECRDFLARPALNYAQLMSRIAISRMIITCERWAIKNYRLSGRLRRQILLSVILISKVNNCCHFSYDSGNSYLYEFTYYRVKCFLIGIVNKWERSNIKMKLNMNKENAPLS